VYFRFKEKLIDNDLLKRLGGPGCCSWCGVYCQQRDVHHVISKGLGNRFDHPFNLIALGRFPCGCHGAADQHRISQEDLWKRVAVRERISVAQLMAELEKHRRTA
jgi:hypothetical protein